MSGLTLIILFSGRSDKMFLYHLAEVLNQLRGLHGGCNGQMYRAPTAYVFFRSFNTLTYIRHSCRMILLCF